jgi:hypothetical protein
MDLKTIKQKNILGLKGVPALLLTIDVPCLCLDGMMIAIRTMLVEKADKFHDLQYAMCFKALVMSSNYDITVTNDMMQQFYDL